MNYLGIESSCDETAVAIVQKTGDHVEVVSHALYSQMADHIKYGGVVPEVAARSHLEIINPLINQALKEADLDWTDLTAMGVTRGPGLSGSLLVGTLAAKTISMIKGVPLYGLNHVLGHVYASFVKPADVDDWQEPQFPLLALIVSGGHTQLVYFKNHFDYEILGKTLDDAVGEAFDKVAKVIGLPYPGGPSISIAAESGNDNAFRFPHPRTEEPYDFSFSGLKTAVLREVQRQCGKDYTFASFKLKELLSESQTNDFAASFQKTAVDILVEKTQAVLQTHPAKSFVLAGGVAANTLLREALSRELPDVKLHIPQVNLCTDNAVMIAGLCAFEAGRREQDGFAQLKIQPNLSM